MPTSHEGPVVRVRVAADGRPLGASATARIERPLAEVWAAVADTERYARNLPMVHRAKRRGDSVAFDLKFRVGFFSVGFEFTADVVYEAEKWLELRWTSGEPKDIRLRFALTPTDDGKACLVEGDAQFDLHSLGWLVKYFLKHHPEIQHGIFPGVALVLIDSLRQTLDEGDGKK
jgi:ribosome-associated toxin RatA of RatAB toxin-antitoxin module